VELQSICKKYFTTVSVENDYENVLRMATMRSSWMTSSVILDDLEWPRDDEAEGVETFSLVEHDVTRSDVVDGQTDGQCPEAAVVCTAEGRVLVKHGSVEMDAHVGSRTRRTVAQYLNK